MFYQVQDAVVRQPAVVRYVIAIITSAAAIALTMSLRPYIGPTHYLFSWLALIANSALLGLGPGLLTAILSVAGVTYFALPAQHSFDLLFSHLLSGLMLAVSAYFISALARRKLKAQKELLTITNAIPAGIAYIDREGRYQFGNAAYYSRFGISPQELRGKTVEEVLGPDAFATTQPFLERALTGEPVAVEVETRDKHGRPLILRADYIPAPPVRGLIPGIYVLSTDVTTQRDIEASLRASEEKYRLASKAGQVGIWDWDIVANKVTWSDKIYEFHGVKPGEYDGTMEGFAGLVHPEDKPEVTARLDKALREGGRYQVEFRAVRPDGQIRWIAAEAEAIMKDQKAVRLIGASIDVTERKQAEERQRRTIAAGKVGLWEWNIATGEVQWSDHLYGFYGLKQGDFKGTVDHFAELIYPDDRKGVMERLRDAMENNVPYDLEMRIIRSDGEIRWLWTTGEIERDASGKPMHMRGTALDITERKRWEESLSQLNQNLEKDVAARVEQLTKQEAELYQARKLEAIGQLAGGVAHDFNNLITGIMGIAEGLHDSLSAEDPRREDTGAIMKASQRTAELTRQLLAFGRRQIADARIIDLNSAVREIAKLLNRLIREDIPMELNLGEPVSIKVDITQLQQILMNLVLNARDAMPNGGTLTLSTGTSGERAILRVRDTGVGMTKEVFEHLFEPFYTTKEANKGTGLGLATVYGIVKQNNGDIDVASAPGEGSVFTIYFPIATGEPTAPATVGNVGPGGGETILLVEDEDVVRYVIAKKLRQAGYTVLTASHGIDAIEQARRQPLDLILTDVIMPGMNGPQVATRVRELHPKIAVLYMSGYPEDVIAHSGVLQAGIDFLEKPVVSHQVVQKVRELLDRSRTLIPHEVS